jgi:hypothetical protein
MIEDHGGEFVTHAPSATLGRTGFELQHERAPWARSRLYRLCHAIQAAGAARTAESAHTLVRDAQLAVGEHTPVREALAHAGVDVRAVARELRLIEEDAKHQARADELAMFKSVLRQSGSVGR